MNGVKGCVIGNPVHALAQCVVPLRDTARQGAVVSETGRGPSPDAGRRTTGWSYGHNPRAGTQVRHCGCEDCSDWFAEYDATLDAVTAPAREPS